jgi:hypothetical protein
VKQFEVRTPACTRTIASDKLITFAIQIIQQKLAVVVQESPQKFTVRYDFRNALSAIRIKIFNYFKEELTAQEIVRGERNVKVGKDPLPFSLYRFLCKNFSNNGQGSLFLATI